MPDFLKLRLVVSEHARKEMDLRHISLEQVREALKLPDHVRAVGVLTWIVEKELPTNPSKTLRLLIADGGDFYRLVTAYPLSTIRAKRGRQP